MCNVCGTDTAGLVTCSLLTCVSVCLCQSRVTVGQTDRQTDRHATAKTTVKVDNRVTVGQLDRQTHTAAKVKVNNSQVRRDDTSVKR